MFGQIICLFLAWDAAMSRDPVKDNSPVSIVDWCSVVVRRGSASSGVVHVTWPCFKITWSVAKNPRVTEQCDVSIHSLTTSSSP
ncbi:hypothetical protein TNCV_228481 [Trichonephila clavipes]|nr:hypothetical protein TNCV_228481 [Trichonephila clavipes]